MAKAKKHKLKEGFKKFINKAKHPFEVLMDVAISPGKLAAFSALAPFSATMIATLKKKNVKVPGAKIDYPENLARQFYQVVILKQPPLTKGVGLADKHKLESADAADAAKAAVGTAADAAVDQAAKGISSTGLVGSLAGTAIQIIHSIIHFLTANKKKAANPSAPLTPEEKAVMPDNTPADPELAKQTDKVQDILVTAGVGNLKSDGTHVAETHKEDDYGHGFGGFLRKLLHIPKHHENLQSLIEELEAAEEN
ncbi:MAG: hypothetical protein ACHQII_01945 [Bacteroidia bacterium]